MNGVLDLPWWGYVLVVLALTHVTIAGVTIFLHRHQAHRALDMHPLPAHFFRFWLWLTTGMITREWAAIHRKHHARCETPEDPHSPQQVGLPTVLFGGVFLYVRESRNQATLERYGQGTPDDWIERRLYTPLHKFGIVLMLAIDVYLFGLLPGALIWGVQMVWIPFWAAGVINGVGHFWGYRSFNCEDASRNIVPWGILIGGEELHNNHHAFAASARLSNKWYEFDIGWLYICLLAAMGLARVKKIAPRLRLTAPRQVVDGATLQALITHRYDLLARYAKSLRQSLGEEIKRRGDDFDRRQARFIQRWLAVDARHLPADIRARVEQFVAGSAPLAKLYTMRQELSALWERTNASREQLVAELEDWVRRAEASGVRQLEEIACRLRSYAVTA